MNIAYCDTTSAVGCGANVINSKYIERILSHQKLKHIEFPAAKLVFELLQDWSPK